jgi:hypothetical protein
MRRYHLITNTCLFLLVVLFAYTAINKLAAIHRFQFQLSTFPWLKANPTPIAWAVIATEFAIVLLLLMPRRTRAGFIAALILLSIFTTYLLIMLLTTPNLPCTCGGVLEQLSWPQHIGANLLFIGITILGMVAENRERRQRRAHQLRKPAVFSIPHT